MDAGRPLSEYTEDVREIVRGGRACYSVIILVQCPRTGYLLVRPPQLDLQGVLHLNLSAEGRTL